MSDRKNYSVRLFAVILCCATVLMLAGCSSVFKAGVSGKVVDAESTSTPKAGIANVQVYAYTKEADRNRDYDAYVANPNGRFYPSSSSYIGRTTTGTNGTFVVSKLVWESMNPEFGKTADYSRLYLLFYHDDYGLHKNTGDVVVVSDSNNADTVYEELTKINKTTELNLNIKDVGTGALLTTPVNVVVKVPQSASDTSKFKEYKQTIVGNGTITVTYPRYSDSTVDSQQPFTPTVEISLVESSDEIVWKQAFNGELHNGQGPDFAFFTASDKCLRQISGDSYTVNAYMKATKISYPTLSGQIQLDGLEAGSRDEGKVTDDNVTVWLAEGQPGKFTPLLVDGEAVKIHTYSSGDGANNSKIRHGLFENLGEKLEWKGEDTYTEQYLSKTVYIVVDAGGTSGQIDSGDYYYQLTLKSNESNPQIPLLTKTSMTLIN